MIRLITHKLGGYLHSCLCIIALFFVDTLFAQSTDSGVAAIIQVADDIKMYLPGVQLVVYSIAGIVATVGAVIAFWKITHGEQDASKNAMMLVGGCIFLIAAVTALPAFFGL